MVNRKTSPFTKFISLDIIFTSENLSAVRSEIVDFSFFQGSLKPAPGERVEPAAGGVGAGDITGASVTL